MPDIRAIGAVVGVLVLGVAPALGAPPPRIAGLEAGRTVWLGTCQVCHAEPDSGAPQLGDAAAWRARAGQGREQLYAHALQGFSGPDGSEMPARGGNAVLSDGEVRSAVDYMLSASGQ